MAGDDRDQEVLRAVECIKGEELGFNGAWNLSTPALDLADGMEWWRAPEAVMMARKEQGQWWTVPPLNSVPIGAHLDEKALNAADFEVPDYAGEDGEGFEPFGVVRDGKVVREETRSHRWLRCGDYIDMAKGEKSKGILRIALFLIPYARHAFDWLWGLT